MLFTHRSLYTKKKLQFYLCFWRSTIISCERVTTGTRQSQFYRSFWRSNLISCEKVARNDLNSHFYIPQFLAIEPHFVRKGCAGHLEIAILPQFLTIEPHFVRKGCAGRLANRTFTTVFDDRTSLELGRAGSRVSVTDTLQDHVLLRKVWSSRS